MIGPSVWPSKGLLCSLGVQHELAAFRRGDRGHDGDLAGELVRRSRLALADAFYFRGVQRIDLLAGLAVILLPHPKRQIEQRRERSSSAALPSILRRMSRMIRPNLVRRNLSARRARLN